MPTSIDMPNFKMIHIVSELVALVGITFYFTQKYNKLAQDIKKLQATVQSHESQIQSQDKIIKDLVAKVNRLSSHEMGPPPEILAQMMAGMPGGMPGGMHGMPGMGPGMPSGPMFSFEVNQTKRPGQDDIRFMSDNEDVVTHKMKTDTGLDTDSQLDADLADELAELAKTDDTNEPEKSTKDEKNSERDLNTTPSDNNSILSINDVH